MYQPLIARYPVFYWERLVLRKEARNHSRELTDWWHPLWILCVLAYQFNVIICDCECLSGESAFAIIFIIALVVICHMRCQYPLWCKNTLKLWISSQDPQYLDANVDQNHLNSVLMAINDVPVINVFNKNYTNHYTDMYLYDWNDFHKIRPLIMIKQITFHGFYQKEQNGQSLPLNLHCILFPIIMAGELAPKEHIIVAHGLLDKGVTHSLFDGLAPQSFNGFLTTMLDRKS